MSLFQNQCKQLKRIVVCVFFLLLSNILITITPIFAQTTTPSGSENFTIDLKSTYTVTATGKTIVEQKFTIKNKTPELFVSKYGIVASSTNLSNISVTHNGKNLEPNISKSTGQTSIGVTFADPVVGEGKSNELIISYSDQDIALISGKILEVNIPKLNDQYQYQNYQVELRVPSIFNTPSRINPSNFTLSQDGDYNVISYSNLGNQSISAIFGHQQLFDLKLNYYLQNPTSQTALTQITLPPETPTQQVYYLHLDPLPKEVKEDADGNFIATYEIPANNSFYVKLLAQVKLQLAPSQTIPFSQVLPEHTTPQKFWESQDEEIQKIAASLDSVQAVYDYSVKTLHYTTKPLDQFIERLGAKAAIQEKNLFEATCQEYTDLFIALARNKNIPSRRIVGIAYSSNEELRPSNLNSDVLHTWPEYYDQTKKAWISVDPTWQSTTGGVDYFNNFDLNHIALAINGVSSTLPHPAGSYIGASDEQNKKIYLDFAKEEIPLPNPDLEVNLIAKKIAGIEIPGNYELHIYNKTGKTWYLATINAVGKSSELILDQNKKPSKILPFAKLTLPLSVYNKQDRFQSDQITIDIIFKEGQATTHEFNVKPSLNLQAPRAEQVLVVGGGLILITLLAGSLFLLGRKLTSSLRRQGQKLEEQNQQLQILSTALKENQQNDPTRQRDQISNPRQRA